MTWKLDYRNSVLKAYPEVYTPAALEALEVLVPLNRDRRELMARRIARRLARENGRQRIAFLDLHALIPRTRIRVQDARDGNFEGSEIPGRSEAPVDPAADLILENIMEYLGGIQMLLESK